MTDLYRADLIDSRTLRELDLEEDVPADERPWFDSLNKEIDDYWDPVQIRDGLTLVHERYFEDYARQLAEDTGAIDDDAHWPATHIDWPAAADELKMDYTELDVEVDGVTDSYYVLTN